LQPVATSCNQFFSVLFSVEIGCDCNRDQLQPSATATEGPVFSGLVWSSCGLFPVLVTGHGNTNGETIADQAAANMLHESIDVPDNRCPFNEEPRNIFLGLLKEIQAQNIIPNGYSVTEQEWVHGFYPTHEPINIGRG
jgi:hypothetical protein